MGRRRPLDFGRGRLVENVKVGGDDWMREMWLFEGGPDLVFLRLLTFGAAAGGALILVLVALT